MHFHDRFYGDMFRNTSSEADTAKIHGILGAKCAASPDDLMTLAEEIAAALPITDFQSGIRPFHAPREPPSL